MPMILTPVEAATLIGAKCGGSAPDADDPELLALLKGMVARVEAAMNVDSLTYGDRINRFYLNEMPAQSARGPVKATLRLTAGYVDPTFFIWKDEDGTVLEPPSCDKVDTVLGTVDIMNWERGYYTLEYCAGLRDNAPDDPLVFQDVPEWMKSATVSFLVLWYRTVYLAPKTVKGLQHATMLEGLYRQINSLIYMNYQRPRMNVVWGDPR